MKIILFFLLNIIFVAAVWHLDINHNLEKYGQKKTGGVLKITPERGFRISEYVLLVVLFLLDVLFLI